MFATAGVQEASSLHDYAISFGILVFLPIITYNIFIFVGYLLINLI
jgi:hypothetical protein